MAPDEKARPRCLFCNRRLPRRHLGPHAGLANQLDAPYHLTCYRRAAALGAFISEVV